jgi:hypothetical protein
LQACDRVFGRSTRLARRHTTLITAEFGPYRLRRAVVGPKIYADVRRTALRGPFVCLPSQFDYALR